MNKMNNDEWGWSVCLFIYTYYIIKKLRSETDQG